MIQRAVTAIIGVVLGLFATFAVFSAILAGLDSFYLLTQDACNYGSDNSPKRVLRIIAENPERRGEVDDLDWTADGIGLDNNGGDCVADAFLYLDTTYLAPNGDVFYRSGAVLTEGDSATLPAGEAIFGIPWIEAENVFTAQRQLVTLLAVIAAIGMPIGAMTAIVFFGQAVISAGVSGQGASQVLVAIAAVVIILVAVQMFQQFAGYLGNAFDSVNADRFVVFDETLGSLAETIAEFWGVLAFAGLINIATIVWRNYSGNFNIGGTQGGL